MTDRNQKAKAQFAQAQMRRQFTADFAAGQTGAFDKERTKLEVGHLVVWNPPPDIFYWLVQDVAPVLDQPQPAVRVTLTITIPIVLPPNRRMGNMLVVGKQGEEEPGALAKDTFEERQAVAGGKSDQQPEGEQTDGADAAPKPTD